MTFLNAALLLGAIAAAGPILIHLLNRRRRRTVDWAAMFLIDEVSREDRRRVRLKQWILLLLRTAAVLLLAGAMARPVLTAFRSADAGAATQAVLVIDDRFDMAAPAQDGRPLIRHATDAARRIHDALGEGVRFATTSGVAVDAQDLDTLQAAGPGGRADAAVATAREQLRTATAQRKLVVFIGDGRNGPADADLPAVAVGPPLDPVPNVRVESVELRPAVIRVGRTIEVRALLRNMSELTARGIDVTLDVDDNTERTRRLALGPDAVTEVLFQLPLNQSGDRAISVGIATPEDQVPGDDALHAVARVRDRLRALVITETNDGPFGENSGDFLALALSSTFDPQVKTVTAVEPSDLEEAALVVMADASPDERLSGPLRDWVASGGALMMWLGEDGTASWLGDATPALVEAPLDLPATFARGPYDHPALSEWNDFNGDLGIVSTTRRTPLVPATDAQVVLTFADGEPAIVHRTFGRGGITLAALPADGSWSDLPLRAAFVPLVQQLAGQLLQVASPTGSVFVGAPFPADRLDGTLLSSPSGEVIDLEHNRVLLEPGHYTVEPTGESLIAANLPRPAVGPTTVTGEPVDAFLDRLREAEVGREIWRTVAIALLVVLFGELLLSGRFSREVQA
jgi:hypothetical protein